MDHIGAYISSIPIQNPKPITQTKESAMSSSRTLSIGFTPARRSISLISLYSLWRSRRALALVETARLADMGLTVDQARAESLRSVWDVPTNWLR
ncbi:MAG: hypothetical protein ACI95S_002486 [Dinoroseobacter sp.]|jgi:uncharacterized protein YjiS (DUF1127 family)